jgi:hypothetical protein
LFGKGFQGLTKLNFIVRLKIAIWVVNFDELKTIMFLPLQRAEKRVKK